MALAAPREGAMRGEEDGLEMARAAGEQVRVLRVPVRARRAMVVERGRRTGRRGRGSVVLVGVSMARNAAVVMGAVVLVIVVRSVTVLVEKNADVIVNTIVGRPFAVVDVDVRELTAEWSSR